MDVCDICAEERFQENFERFGARAAENAELKKKNYNLMVKIAQLNNQLADLQRDVALQASGRYRTTNVPLQKDFDELSDTQKAARFNEFWRHFGPILAQYRTSEQSLTEFIAHKWLQENGLVAVAKKDANVVRLEVSAEDRRNGTKWKTTEIEEATLRAALTMFDALTEVCCVNGGFSFLFFLQVFFSFFAFCLCFLFIYFFDNHIK
jgi:hypothetical protein